MRDAIRTLLLQINAHKSEFLLSAIFILGKDKLY